MNRTRRNALSACAALATGTLLSACGGNEATTTAVATDSTPRFSWKLLTSWTRDFPGLGGAARRLAERISRMSGGRLTVSLYAADEMVPAFGVFDAVAEGRAEMGHSSPAFWAGKSPACTFFAGVPFGLTAQEMNAWLLHGGGLALWRQVYGRFGLRPYPCGNTGTQLAGWFKREVRSLKDFKGLKMRVTGLAAEVLRAVGGEPVAVAGVDLVQAMADEAIAACEWLGPYNDLAMGVHESARFCYYPGWQEPGSLLELMVNKRAFDELPDDLQAIVEGAAQSVNEELLAEYAALNAQALVTLASEHGTEFRKLPDDALAALKQAAEQIVGGIAGSDPLAQQVYASYLDFREQSRQWQRISEQAFVQARG